jgi:hypothetical protein
MPRYFFHVQDGERIPDEEGLVLPGPDAARKEAVVAAGEMLKDSAAKVWTGEDWRMWVVDEAGKPVCALRFTAETGPSVQPW